MKYLAEVGRESHNASKSAVLNEILREKRREWEIARSEAAISAYYDSLSDQQLEENEAWGAIDESQFPPE